MTRWVHRGACVHETEYRIPLEEIMVLEDDTRFAVHLAAPRTPHAEVYGVNAVLISRNHVMGGYVVHFMCYNPAEEVAARLHSRVIVPEVQEARFTPFVWEKEEDGSDYITAVLEVC